MVKYESKEKVSLWLRKDSIRRIRDFAYENFNQIYKILGDLVSDAIDEYLERHCQNAVCAHTNMEYKYANKSHRNLALLAKTLNAKYLDFRQEEIDQEILSLGIGSTTRTYARYTELLLKFELIYPHRKVFKPSTFDPNAINRPLYIYRVNKEKLEEFLAGPQLVKQQRETVPLLLEE
jgi:hypothetical protein